MIKKQKLIYAQKLTVAELKDLLFARLTAEQARQQKLQARCCPQSGANTRAEKQEDSVITRAFANRISDVLARRLKLNRRATPLISSRDFTQLAEDIARFEGEKLGAGERKMLKGLMTTIVENIDDVIRSIAPRRKNPYEQCWRWVEIVLEVAADRGVQPAKLFAIEEANDEITRRMLSRKQFVSLSRKAMEKFMDANVLMDIIIRPVLAGFAEGEEKERHELERHIMPQLRKLVKKSKSLVAAWVKEETNRIYPAARV